MTFINKLLTIWAELNLEEQIKSDNHFLTKPDGTTRCHDKN